MEANLPETTEQATPTSEQHQVGLEPAIGEICRIDPADNSLWRWCRAALLEIRFSFNLWLREYIGHRLLVLAADFVERGPFNELSSFELSYSGTFSVTSVATEASEEGGSTAMGHTYRKREATGGRNNYGPRIGLQKKLVKYIKTGRATT